MTSGGSEESDILIIVDRNGNIHSFNKTAENFSGYRRRDVLGKNISLILPRWNDRDGGRSIQNRVHSAGPAGMPDRLREILVTRDRTIARVELTVSDIWLGEEQLHLLLLRDLVSAEKFEGQLRQAQKMEAIGHLAGGIAHDFNNLLTIIMGNLEMLERTAKGATERSLIRDAHETAELGAHLAKRLLTLGRHQTTDVRLIDLGATIEEFMSLLKRALGERILIRFEASRRLLPVRVDPALLQMCLFNLALNARDAMPGGGSLHIRVEPFSWKGGVIADAALARGNYLLLTVSDTGDGMPEAVRQRALEPFFTTKTLGKGTGLGLSMVHGFVQQAEGRMVIESKEGEGTTIRIYLPAHALQEKKGPARRVDREPFPQGAGERVLVVEDDARVRRWTAARLAELNYRVEEAVSGAEALENLARHDDIAMLVTDYVMPGDMNGYKLARAARDMRPRIGIVITTGYARPEPDEQDPLDGMMWLAKPYKSGELARCLKQALAGRMRRAFDEARPDSTTLQ